MNFPPVLDACCGSRMFWFDPNDPRALYLDRRRETHELKDASQKSGFRTLVVNPDVLGDFSNLPFRDEQFAVVVFDPPHLESLGDTGWLAKKYGRLSGDWRSMLQKGFAECFRVLKNEGTLIFKWNERDISVSEILSLTPHSPLVGQRGGKTMQSHFIVFLKIGDSSQHTDDVI